MAERNCAWHLTFDATKLGWLPRAARAWAMIAITNLCIWWNKHVPDSLKLGKKVVVHG